MIDIPARRKFVWIILYNHEGIAFFARQSPLYWRRWPCKKTGSSQLSSISQVHDSPLCRDGVGDYRRISAPRSRHGDPVDPQRYLRMIMISYPPRFIKPALICIVNAHCLKWKSFAIELRMTRSFPRAPIASFTGDRPRASLTACFGSSEFYYGLQIAYGSVAFFRLSETHSGTDGDCYAGKRTPTWPGSGKSASRTSPCCDVLFFPARSAPMLLAISAQFTALSSSSPAASAI